MRAGEEKTVEAGGGRGEGSSAFSVIKRLYLIIFFWRGVGGEEIGTGGQRAK